MLRSEIIDLLKSGLEVLRSSSASPDEKVSGMMRYLEDAIEETVHGVTVDHVRAEAVQKVNSGKKEHVKVLLQVLGAQKLDDLKERRDALGAMLYMIKQL